MDDAAATTNTGAEPADRRRAVAAGGRAMTPLIVALAPFGLLIGATVAQSDVPAAAGWAGSLLVFAGTAHLAAIGMLDAGAAPLAVIGAVAVINARLLVLSAAMSSSLRRQPVWFRLVAAFFIVEPTYAVASTRLSDADDPARWRAFYLGAAAWLAVGWSALIATGLLVGPALPSGGPMEFASPALLISMLVPQLVSRPALLAAAVGGVVAVMTSGLPNALNLILGGFAGMVVAVLADRSRS